MVESVARTSPGAPANSSAIAVIGMAGRFPGARNIDAFWANLRDGAESIHFFTEEALRAAGESPGALRDPSYVKACGRLDDIDQFDAAFFGMSPRDAAVFDPQHRLFLECAWETFEDAGYVGENVGGAVGVFASSGAGEYLMHNVLANREIMRTVGAWLARHTGNDTNFLATRVSYELNLRGPSMSVQSACSSSLLAVHVACQSLLNGECDMALAGGATVYPRQDRGYVHRKGEILSPDGHCRAFDSQAAGTVMSSAVGCVLLKRLDDALRDGDRVTAIVLGSAANNDGSDKVGYLAPSLSGQARVITEALSMAGVDAEDVSYVEAHGTGTLIGDPIEVRALTEAFRTSTNKKTFCAIGSVKTNVGHAGEAAGICGFIKTALALEHRQLPPSLHYREPNPQAELPSSPFFVSHSLRDWAMPAGKARIAGVTALGAGGTNVHVLLREAPDESRSVSAANAQLLVVSARTKSALDLATQNLAAHLRAHPEVPLADVAYTLLAGRRGFEFRRAVVAADALDAAQALESGDAKRVTTHEVARQKSGSPPRVVFMFPGGGSQYGGMGAELYARQPVYRDAIESCLSHLPPPLGAAIRSALVDASVPAVEPSGLEAASLALPALFSTEYAIAKLFESWGIRPAEMVGHSAGEYAAACLAGVFTLRDAVSLVALRGRLFEALPEGGMLSVALPEEDLRPLLRDGLSLAAVNAPALCVASGPAHAIGELEAALRAREVDCARVHLPIAAHSTMVESILGEFEAYCRTIALRPPRVPFVSNLTGNWISDAEATDPGYWARHLRETVRFHDGLQKILETGDKVLVEVGPGRTLSSFARQAAKFRPGSSTTTLRHPQEEASDVALLLSAVGRLWGNGVPLDDSRLFAGQARRRVRLPTYPFERRRHWVDPDASLRARDRAGDLEKRPDIGEWFYAPSWGRLAPATPVPADRDPTTWLVFTDASRLSGRIVRRIRSHAGDRVVTVAPGRSFKTVAPMAYTVDASNAQDYELLARELRRLGLMPGRVVHLWSLPHRRRRANHAIRDLVWTTPRRSLRRPVMHRMLHDYARNLALDHFSLVFFARAFAGDLEGLRLDILSSAMHTVPGDIDQNPEKAVISGARRVLSREYPRLACTSIDVALPSTRRGEEGLAAQLMTELRAGAVDGDVALRGRDRWIRRFDRVPLPQASEQAWLRRGGVYLVTGGLGGLGLAVAEHLAGHANAKLVLVGRTAHPDDERLRTLRAMGADVMIAAADVTDLAAMRDVVARVHSRYGRIHGVFHAAGQLRDELVALREPRAVSPVLDTKMKGALVLDAVTARDDPELFVLFSSVSSILGLPGQADYSAANAFLDAFAFARGARDPARRTLAIDWNAWQEVGMLAALVDDGQNAVGPGGSKPNARASAHPLLEVIESTPATALFRGSLRRAAHWPLSEHVVRGGSAVMPGTGMLELARAAVAHDTPRSETSVELRDVVFLAPFVLDGDARVLHVRIDRSKSAFAIFGRSERETFVSGRIARADAAPPPREWLETIRARCLRKGAVADHRLVQHFMDFGPRWACVESIRLGDREAILDLRLPDAFASDLDAYRLHPALLDMAVGGAQALIPDFDPTSHFYVPFSYGRLLLRRALPAWVVSHVRLRQGGARESPVFDATLYDEGGEEVARIEAFMMRRATSGAHGEARAGQAPRAFGQGGDDARRAALRVGMTPVEGIEALDRMLASPMSPQVVACTVDLEVWLDRLTDESRLSRAAAKARDAEATEERPPLSAAFAAPRDTVERELAELWRELLGGSEVGIHDDFFELGGQSLIAVRMFHRLGKKYGIELPLATLFEAPTIAHCAAILRGRLDVPEVSGDDAAVVPGETEDGTRPVASSSALVTIQPGSGWTPFFCVHGAGGNVLNFRDLARAMDTAQPFYGLQAQGVDGVTPPHETIEQMATAYLAEVRALQPEGPYLLGGYSGGGLVAFEMAQRLTAEGQDVRLLAFIDTFHPEMPIRKVTMRARVERLREEGLGYAGETLSTRRNAWRRPGQLRAIEEFRARRESIPFALRDLDMTRNFERAALRYRPKAWPGKAILFRASRIAYIYRDGGPYYGWERYVLGGVEVVPVSGDHSTIVTGANAGVIARALSVAMASARPHRSAVPMNGALPRGREERVPAEPNRRTASPYNPAP